MRISDWSSDVCSSDLYSAPFNRQLEGAYKLVHYGESYVMTQMEPLGARLAFPGLDEPAFKRPWDITLIVPQDQNAVANTRLVEETKLADGFKRLRFARTENLPSYLIAFAVGPWAKIGRTSGRDRVW